MVLGKRGRRSHAARWTAWLVLSSMVVGQWQMVFAGSAHSGGPLLGTSVGTAESEPTISAGPVERIRPVRCLSVDSHSEASQLTTLFDERAGVGLITDGPTRFKVVLPQKALIQSVGVYNDADGALAVISDQKDSPETVVDLHRNSPRWNRFAIAKPIQTTALTLEWRPSHPGAMLREIELWGIVAGASDRAREVPRLPDDLFRGLPAGAHELTGMGSSLPISVATVFGGGEGGRFTVTLNQEPASYERVFLIYELSGLAHFTAAMRAINGRRTVGGRNAVLGSAGGLQVEEISPTWLAKGANNIQFLPIDESDPAGYRVDKLRIVGLPRSSFNLANQEAWQGVIDHNEATTWVSSHGKKQELKEWQFTRRSQPEAIEFRLSRAGAGKIQMMAGGKGTSAKATIDLSGFAAGWHRVPLSNLPATDKLLLSLVGGKEQDVAISELAISASPLPVDDAPRMEITYPLSGGCVNHRVYVRGFIEPEGPATLYVNGAAKQDALSSDGSLSFEVSDREAGSKSNKPFRVDVEARYVGGVRIRRTVSIDGCVEQPALVKGYDGRSRLPVEDVGAPYAGVVRAAAATSLSFADATIDVPAGAVERDMKVSIRPLSNDRVPPMDSGMTNITPGQQAYRFGPHGMIFKKAVKLALPYDKSLIPVGYTEADVRTFYYDENLKKWEQVGLLAQGKGALLALSEHFTDFINATIAKPESPGPLSLNPTSMKDIKVANPAAGITLIEPPVPNSRGTANVHMPIEVPPGRNGLQPQLAISYDSDAGNGWLGVGWNVQTPSVEIDTRFGVPKYDGSETYLLDGAALTKRVDVPTGAPTDGEHYIRRVEGAFDYIMKVGTSSDYYWVVVDKNGTRRIYGNSESSRLSPSNDNKHTFKWFLDRVEDTYGNFITYEYRKATGNTPDGDTSGLPWVQVYPSRIAYTGGSNLTPPYAILFHSSESDHWGLSGSRLDTISTARSGFDVRTRELLDEIEVWLEATAPTATTIRRYHLAYGTGDFAKTVLQSIGVYGPTSPQKDHPEIGRFHQHNLEYFSSNKGFSKATVWANLANTNFSKGGLSGESAVQAGFDAFVGVGPTGCPWYVGGGGRYSAATDVSDATMVDVNGDGLPDLVDKSGRILLNGFADNTQAHGKFSSAQLTVPADLTCGGPPLQSSAGLPFSSTTQSTLSASVGGRTFGGMVGGGKSWSWTWGQQNAGITDFDGDGLPDFATTCGGFNVFSTKYDASGKLQISRSDFDTTIDQPDAVSIDPLTDEQRKRLHPLSSLASWTAPYDGTVQITGPVWRDPGVLAAGAVSTTSGKTSTGLAGPALVAPVVVCNEPARGSPGAGRGRARGYAAALSAGRFAGQSGVASFRGPGPRLRPDRDVRAHVVSAVPAASPRHPRGPARALPVAALGLLRRRRSALRHLGQPPGSAWKQHRARGGLAPRSRHALCVVDLHHRDGAAGPRRLVRHRPRLGGNRRVRRLVRARERGRGGQGGPGAGGDRHGLADLCPVHRVHRGPSHRRPSRRSYPQLRSGADRSRPAHHPGCAGLGPMAHARRARWRQGGTRIAEVSPHHAQVLELTCNRTTNPRRRCRALAGGSPGAEPNLGRRLWLRQGHRRWRDLPGAEGLALSNAGLRRRGPPCLRQLRAGCRFGVRLRL
jgi:hypothetical protein